MEGFPSAFALGSYGSYPTRDNTLYDVRAIREEAPYVKNDPMAGITPPAFSRSAEGNQVRLGIVQVMREYWRFMGRMSGDIFYSLSGPEIRQNPPARALARPARFTKVIPNRRSFYAPEVYGGDAESEPVEDTGVPTFRSRRFQRRVGNG